MNISEFFAMGGHGLYVWISWGAFVLVIAYNSLAPRIALRQLSRSLVRQQRRNTLQKADQTRQEGKSQELLGRTASNES